MSLSLLGVLAMDRQYEIRQRRVEISTDSPDRIPADAILLPWTVKADYEEGAEFAADAHELVSEAVLEEIADYRGEREVMLTSADQLPARFLFHLSLPESLPVDVGLIEELFRDSFFQASVLGLRVLAIPILEFTPYTDRFPELVGAVWKACSEFLAREQGPQRLVFLVEDRDLRGQYLRHFFRRKEIEDMSWSAAEEHAQAGPVLPAPQSPPRSQAQGEGRNWDAQEWILSPDPEACAGLAELSAEFLGNPAQAATAPASLLSGLLAALTDCLPAGAEDLTLLPPRMRLLGPAEVLGLPWELVAIPSGAEALGEHHLLVRGTNFLHFSRRREGTTEKSGRLSLGLMGEPAQLRARRGELEALALARDLELAWEEEGEGRLIHVLDPPRIEPMLAGLGKPCELLFLEASASGGREPCDLDETAAQLLAKGCRRVLAPLAPFSAEEQRREFLSAFYGKLFEGAPAGEALLHAQQLLRARFGASAGWFLYRIFGQAQGSPLPGGLLSTRREPLGGRV